MKTRMKKVFIITIALILALSSAFAVVALAQNDWSFAKTFSNFADGTETGKKVGDYTGNHGELTGEKIRLDDPVLEEKSWYEYVGYVYSYTSEPDEDGNIYKIYLPADIANNSIMAIRDYELDGVGNNVSVGITFMDMLPIFEQIAAANMGVGLSGGVTAAMYGGITQVVVAGTIWGTMALNDNLLRNSKYYCSSSFMGIPDPNATGKDKWDGVSNNGYYNASSLTISMSRSSQYSVQKTNTVSSGYTTSGKNKVDTEVKIPLLANTKAGFESNISSALNYGVNFQQSQSVNNSETVSRTFSARTDKEVNGVPWKLCEYIVEVPFYLEQYDSEGNFVTDAYVTYTYLNGVCRVFANGYIEHWNTGKLVTYADFFEGFHTAAEIINEAKALNLLD